MSRPVPTTYRQQIDTLERRVLKLQRQLAESREAAQAARDALRDLAGKLKTIAPDLVATRREKGLRNARDRYAEAHRCGECGADAGRPCRTLDDKVTRRPHHVRGRSVPCGNTRCLPCKATFALVPTGHS